MFAALAWVAALGGGSFAFAAGSSGGRPASGMSGALGDIGVGSALGGPLVLPALSLEGELLAAAQAARLANPEAVLARKRSRTEFEHLGTAQVLTVAREAFPGAVNEPAGGAPKLPAGERILKYEARNAAAIALPDGKHGVVESLGPIARPIGHGRFTPINLALHSTANGYASASSDVAVQIPKHASAGVRMPGDGVSLTPVNAHGQPLGGSEGAQEGASVLYANTQTDTDTLAKPTASGFEIDSLLRSVDSPETLQFRIGMPAGARLVSDKGPGEAQVVLDGRAIAMIAVPGAQDAAGTSVPARLSVSGDILVVAVKHSSSEYQYPIEVDPEAHDATLALPGKSESETETNLSSDSETDWRYHEYPAGKFVAPYRAAEGYDWATKGSVVPGEHDEFRYGAHGQASVGYIEEESSTGVSARSGAITKLEFASHGNAKEAELELAAAGQQYSKVKQGFGDLWNESEKDYGGHNNENLIRIMQTATTVEELPEEDGFWLGLNTGTWVGISQAKGPEVQFNTTEASVDNGRENVLDGKWGWLGEFNGAVAIKATDPGLGISNVKITDLTAGPHGEHWKFADPVYAEQLCTGVWCSPNYETYFTYSKEMAEGPNTFELCAEDEAAMSACTRATINVDDIPPYELKIASGLAEKGAELSATQHRITVEATDGTAPTPSSGIESIQVLVDGREIGQPSGVCLPPGPCTGRGTWTIDGEDIGAGEHQLEIIATDYADNIAKKAVTFAIRNARPMGIGPGSVDPVTGQFTLSASDAEITGAGSVSRTHDSRNLMAGAEGPLGPQWSLSAGNGESIKLLPDGSVELRGAGGEPTIFDDEKGQFKAPQGDENLTLEAKEKEAGKGITEYLLKNAAADNTIVFTRPLEEKQFATPTYSEEVASPGSASGQVNHVGNVAVGPNNNIWVIDNGNHRIDEFNDKREFVKAFGYGVSTGAKELQTCTTTCREGIAGSKEGQFLSENGIAVGSNGKIWTTDSNNRIYEFNEQGQFLGEFGSSSGYPPHGIAVDNKGHVWVTERSPEERVWVERYTEQVLEFNENHELLNRFSGPKKGEAGELKLPSGIVVHGGYVWIANQGNDRVLKFNEKLEYVSQIGEAGEANGQFESPAAIAIDSKGDVWVSDWTYRVQEFSESGAYLGQLDPANGGIEKYWATLGGVAVDSGGNVWVTDSWGPASVDEWSHSTWPSTRTESAAPGDTKAITYRSIMVGGHAVIEPIEELGPVPANVSCGKNPTEASQAELQKALEELKPGCRALSFTYAEKTTAKGEGASEWGEYEGRLAKISLTAYNPAASSKKMETTAVAQYEYDKQGRLRAEWDPRVEKSTACGGLCSPLKTTYGYDAEGHLTGLTPPGEQPWTFTYGTIASDPSTGRLLKVTRAHPEAGESEYGIHEKLREQKETPTNSKSPVLEGSAIVGLPMGVWRGSWSNHPVSYAYQWEDCNSSGGECSAIPGATNANYTVASGDEGHKLVAVVTATNGGGSASLASTASAVVSFESVVPKYASWFGSEGTGEGKFKFPGDVAFDSKENLWVLDRGNDRVQEFTEKGEYEKRQFGSKGGEVGQLNEPDALAVDAKGNIWVADSGNNRIEEFNEKGECIQAFGKAGSGNGELAKPEGIAIDSYGNVWVSDTNNHRVEEFNEKGEYVKTVGSGLVGFPAGIAVGPGGNVWVADWGPNRRLDEFNAKGELVRTAGSSGKGNGQFTQPYGLTVDAYGDVWAVDNGDSRVEEFGPEGEYLTQFGTAGSEEGKFDFVGSTGLAMNAKGEIWVTDSGANHVEKWTPSYTLAPHQNPGPGTTVEYRVPVSGAGAPYAMGVSELAKWAQTKDIPKEATAIFPPDSPEGWPASDYTRATVLYMDEHARTTNTASPSGAISTVEYNSVNELTRKLTASDRAIALKETCESETKCKSAEAAQTLSSESIYNTEGTQLLETYGPEHKVKLPNGTEEETRDRQKFSYNEGKPSNGETYDLLTKAGWWAENGAKEKLDPQEESTAYSDSAEGENGWKLRKPIVVSEKIGEKTSTTIASYSDETGNLLENAVSDSIGAPVSAFQFGSSGSGNGQFNHPGGVALDGSGNVWVADGGNDRIQKLSSSGAFIGAYGSKGAGAGQFEGAWGVAVNKTTGNVYATDPNNSRVQEFNATGTFIRTFGFGVGNGEAKFEICTSSCRAGVAGSGSGQFDEPTGITVDPAGNVWVVDDENDRVEEFKENGEYLSRFGSKGTGNGQFTKPEGVAVSDGDVYVTDTGDDRVEQFSSTGTYLNQWGSKGSGSGQFNVPLGIATDPVSGALFVADRENSRVEEFSRMGTFLTEFGSYGTGEGHIWGPTDVAATPAGSIYVADEYNNRVDQWEPVPSTPIYTSQFGGKGTGNGQFEFPTLQAMTSAGNLWVADSEADRLQEFNGKGEYVTKIGSKGTAAGQFNFPFGVAINPGNGNIYVSDRENYRIQEFSSSGTFIRMFGFGVSNGESKFEICTSGCQIGLHGSGSGQFGEADGVAIDSSGNVWVVDEANNRVDEFSESGEFIKQFGSTGTEAGKIEQAVGVAYENGDLYLTEAGNQRVQEFSTAGTYIAKFGSEGTGNGQFKVPYAIAVGPTSGNLYVTDRENDRVEEFTPSGTFLTSFGGKGSGNGQFNLPTGVVATANEAVYVSDHNNARVEEWSAAARPGNEGAESERTIYYSEAANAEYPACGGRPEWANLPCQSEPVAQPGDSAPPPLPVKTVIYNMWDEPEQISEKFGAVTRTNLETYDSAGRVQSTEEKSTSPEDAALPPVNEEYSAETGALLKESANVKEGTKEGTKTTTAVVNTLGQLASYTDAEGATTKYAYDIDGRVAEIREPMGSQSYAYNPTTGFLEGLQDNGPEGKAGAGKFTATHGVAGELLTVGYPNGMTAKYTYNTIAQATNLEYEKTTHCSEKCVWFSDSEAFDPEGELATQASTLSKETYSYDEAGRLTHAKEESPTGSACIEERTYGYNESTDERTALTTRKANEKGECIAEGGVVEEHDYDVVGRLIDPGVAYDPLGNMTKVPALDAGGQAVTSSFYVDNQVATQEQNGKNIAYTYDPAGRTMIAKSKQGPSSTRTISHYAGPEAASTWACEEEEGKSECEEGKATKWTRNIPGIDGALDAIQTNGGTPVLQLHDLRGNIAATVEDSETAKGLLSTQNSTEFGVVSSGKAPKYGWLGAIGSESELETGVITGAGATYVPQLARSIQTEQVIPPGAAPDGIMAHDVYVPPELPWANESGDEAAENTVAQQRALERLAACEANPLSCATEEDPIKHFRAWEAMRYANELREKANSPDLLKFLASIVAIAEGPEETIEALFGRDSIEEWALNFANMLETCVNELRRIKDSHGGCRADVIDVEPFGWDTGTIDFNKTPIVSWCEGMSSDTKEVHWCYVVPPPREGDESGLE